MSAWSSTVQIRMAKLGLSQQQLSIYSNIHTRALSPFLTGQRDLSGPGLLRVDEALKHLEKLAEIAEPWPIDFRQVLRVQDIVKKIESGELNLLIAATASAREALSPAVGI